MYVCMHKRSTQDSFFRFFDSKLFAGIGSSELQQATGMRLKSINRHLYMKNHFEIG